VRAGDRPSQSLSAIRDCMKVYRKPGKSHSHLRQSQGNPSSRLPLHRGIHPHCQPLSVNHRSNLKKSHFRRHGSTPVQTDRNIHLAKERITEALRMWQVARKGKVGEAEHIIPPLLKRQSRQVQNGWILWPGYGSSKQRNTRKPTGRIHCLGIAQS